MTQEFMAEPCHKLEDNNIERQEAGGRRQEDQNKSTKINNN